MRQKEREKYAELKRQRGNREYYNTRLDKQKPIGLGNGYTTDMRDALKQVQEYDYIPTEDEIHYRRFTTGQFIDTPKRK
jgi:hypothetical protein